jgi:hypothetical protein
MADAKDEDTDLLVVDLIDHPVVTSSDTPFTRTTDQLSGCWWTGIVREKFEHSLDSPADIRRELL